MLKRILLASCVMVAASGAAFAGEQYVDETGFAISGYDPVAYFDLKQAEPGGAQPRADITANYNGATWAFASEEHREMFVANPAKYAPKYDGHCAYGIAQGGKVPANPNLWRIVDGALYLNITPTVAGFWASDISGNINKSEGNWTSLEAKDASDKSWKAISDNDGTYDGTAPVK